MFTMKNLYNVNLSAMCNHHKYFLRKILLINYYNTLTSRLFFWKVTQYSQLQINTLISTQCHVDPRVEQLEQAVGQDLSKTRSYIKLLEIHKINPKNWSNYS